MVACSDDVAVDEIRTLEWTLESVMKETIHSFLPNTGTPLRELEVDSMRLLF